MSRGFRLIDWAFLILIAGLAMGLALPSINTICVRDRRAQCMNNEWQIALALVAYADRVGVFPMSAVEGQGRGHGQSCFMMIMPDLDQQDLYNAYNFSLENWATQSNGAGPSNAVISRTSLSVLRCPSSPFVDETPSTQIQKLDGSFYPGGAIFAKNHYGVNWGGSHPGWGDEFDQTQGAYRGVSMTVRSKNARGEEGRCIGIKDISDGTSQTILLAEKRDSQGWNVGGWAGSEFDVGPSPCYKGSDPRGNTVYSGSDHQGLLNVGFADGSVRSLSETLNRKVWYGLITRDGGEKVRTDELEP
jgi:prepilin-type processing-associated H-X9-DG protein